MPLPEGPTINSNSPACSASDVGRRAVTVASPAGYVFVASRTAATTRGVGRTSSRVGTLGAVRGATIRRPRPAREPQGPAESAAHVDPHGAAQATVLAPRREHAEHDGSDGFTAPGGVAAVFLVVVVGLWAGHVGSG